MVEWSYNFFDIDHCEPFDTLAALLPSPTESDLPKIETLGKAKLKVKIVSPLLPPSLLANREDEDKT